MGDTVRQKVRDSTSAMVSQDVRSIRSRVFLIAKVVGSVVLLFFLFRKLRLPDLLFAVRQADKPFLGLAVFASFLFLLLRAYKWFRIVRPYLAPPNFYRVLTSYMFGLGISIFTPGRIGEVARVANIGITEKSGPTALFLLDKFIDVLVVFSMALYGMYRLLPSGWYASALSVLLVAAFVGLFCMSWIYQILKGAITSVPLGEKLGRICESVAMLDRRKIGVNIALTLSSYIICVFEVYFILNAFCNATLSTVLAVHPIVMTTNVLPITFGGLGLREGASVLLYGNLGIAKEHAFWGGFLIFVFNTLLHGILGTILINVRLRRTT